MVAWPPWVTFATLWRKALQNSATEVVADCTGTGSASEFGAVAHPHLSGVPGTKDGRSFDVEPLESFGGLCICAKLQSVSNLH